MPLGWDGRLFLFLNGLHSPPLDWFFKTITEPDNFRIPFLVLMILVLWKGSARLRVVLLLTLCAVTLSDMIGADLKHLSARLRPCHVFFDAARFLVNESDSFSFPSNHAANSFAAVVFLSLEFRRRKWTVAVLFTIAALIGYSRIYLGAHYPLDVLGGALLGAGCGAGVFILDKRLPVVVRDESARARPSWTALLVWTLVLTTVYRLTYIMQPDNLLAAEEAQYWDWSRHLDWSYYSKPPLIAWAIRATTALFGHTAFAVRVNAVAVSLLLSLIAAFFAWELTRSRRVVFLTVLLIGAIPLFAVGAIVFTTDTPLLLFWGAALSAFHSAIFRNRKAAWYLGGIFLGLGLLSKYAMIYLPACLLLYLLLSKEHRFWLRRPEPYAALLIGAVLFSPVIWWNWKHGFVSFKHVGGNITGHSGVRFDPGAFFEFLGSQLGVLSPFVFLGMIAAAWALLRQKHRPLENDMRYLLCASLPVFFLLLAKSLFGKAQANWAAPAYYAWAILAVIQADRWYEESKRRGKSGRVVAYAALSLATAFAISAFLHNPSLIRAPGAAATLERLGVEKPHRLDPAWRMIGWDSLGRAVTRAREKMPRPSETLILTSYYQTAALLAFYVEGNPRTYCVRFGGRKSQYDLWPGPEGKTGWDALFVTERDSKDRWEKYHRDIGLSFERTDPPEILPLEFRGRVYHTYVLTRCYGFRGAFVKEKTEDVF